MLLGAVAPRLGSSDLPAVGFPRERHTISDFGVRICRLCHANVLDDLGLPSVGLSLRGRRRECISRPRLPAQEPGDTNDRARDQIRSARRVSNSAAAHSACAHPGFRADRHGWWHGWWCGSRCQWCWWCRSRCWCRRWRGLWRRIYLSPRSRLVLRFNSARLVLCDEEIEYKSDQKAQEGYVACGDAVQPMILCFLARLRGRARDGTEMGLLRSA
jgi:hypothetical protein